MILACGGAAGETYPATAWTGTVRPNGERYEGATHYSWEGTCDDESRSRRKWVQRVMCESGCRFVLKEEGPDALEAALAACMPGCEEAKARLVCKDITKEHQGLDCGSLLMVH